MSSSRVRAMGERKARVEILPLIDVMFLLLCFFIYVTMMMVVQKGIFVDLASAKSGTDMQEEKKLLTLSIDHSGQIYLDKELIEESRLKERLREYKKEDPVLVINADKGVEHRRVIGLLDLVRQEGMSEIVFTVEPQS